MQGKTISLKVGNTQHLIPKVMLMFAHRTPVLRTLRHEFPQAANWCSIHRAEFPPIAVEDMTNYYVKTIRI